MKIYIFFFRMEGAETKYANMVCKFESNWNMILIIFFSMQEWYARTKSVWYEICNRKWQITNANIFEFSWFGMQKPRRETIL